MRETAGDVLRDARTRAGLSQVELAARAKVTQSVISVYESGRRQPSLPMLVGLVAAAGFDLQWQLDDTTARLTGPVGRRVRANRARIRDIAAERGVGILGVFGSVARAEDGPDSDVDLLVDVASDVSLIALGAVADALEGLIGAKVDLVPADGVKPDVRRRVDADLIRL